MFISSHYYLTYMYRNYLEKEKSIRIHLAYNHIYSHIHTHAHTHAQTYTRAHTERERERERVCVCVCVCARARARACVCYKKTKLHFKIIKHQLKQQNIIDRNLK